MWIGHKPVLSHLRVWGCPTYLKCLKIDKLKVRSDKYIFIGYSKETKGCYFYLANEQKIFVSLRVVLLEKKIHREGINASKVELDEVQQVEPIQSSESIESDLMMSNLKYIVEAPLRRSDRVSC